MSSHPQHPSASHPLTPAQLAQLTAVQSENAECFLQNTINSTLVNTPSVCSYGVSLTHNITDHDHTAIPELHTVAVVSLTYTRRAVEELGHDAGVQFPTWLGERVDLWTLNPCPTWDA
ncbi:hypothetical protein LTR08_000805 [Meristemomyces frigidus]|nr:hypothetical protein LTR08_000805 [Meristemomyces frigidus]